MKIIRDLMVDVPMEGDSAEMCPCMSYEWMSSQCDPCTKGSKFDQRKVGGADIDRLRRLLAGP